MNNAQPLLHPTLKTALVALDLKLESELARYQHQKEVYSDVSISNTPKDTSALSVTITESSFVQTEELNPTTASLLTQFDNSERGNQKEEPIPVTVRIAPERKTFLEIFLTPWGIFALILFFLGNAIIFINWRVEPKLAKTKNSQPTTSPEEVAAEKISADEQKLSPNQDREKNKQKLSPQTEAEKSSLAAPTELSTIPNISLNQPSPSPSSPLITLNPNPTLEVAVKPQSSQYPDLVKALVANISQPAKNNSKTPANPIPNSRVFPPPPPVIKTTPVNPAPQAKVSLPPPPVTKPTPVSKSTPINPAPQAKVSPTPSPVTKANLNLDSNQSPSSNSKPPTNDLEYYVVSDYADSASLKKIKEIVPHALITNFGNEIKIKLGSFSQESEAIKLLKKVQQQGVSAYIYKPGLEEK